MGPPRRKGGGGGGGKKKGGKKRKATAKQWDDYDPRAEGGGGAALQQPDRKKARGSRDASARPSGPSMFGQWKQKKIQQRNKERAFVSRVDERKHAQRQAFVEQRRRRANAAYGDAPEATPSSSRSTMVEEGSDSSGSEDGSDDDDDGEEEEVANQRASGRKRRSVFDEFVQTFQPSALSNGVEDDDEEEEDEAEYEEIEVDSDGNPIDADEVEEEQDDVDDEDADADAVDAGETVEDQDAAQEEEEEEEEEDGDEAPASAEEEASAKTDALSESADPFRRRFLLGEFTESDAKKYDETPRKFITLSAQNVDDHVLPKSVLDEFLVSFRPGAQAIEPETPLAWVPTSLNIRSRLVDAWKERDVDVAEWKTTSPLEYSLFQQLSSYADVFFAGQTYDLTQPLRRMTAMHTLNHVLKARDTVTRNNERIRKRQNKEKDTDDPADDEEVGEEDDKEYRDQGFSRASVLVLLPLRSSAASFVNELLALLPTTIVSHHNKDRFFDEFGGVDGDDDDDEDSGATTNGKDDVEDMKEWQRVFAEGNNDDSFQIGISLSRRSIKFYSDYRQADIILASPLGLRQQLGDEIVDVAEKQAISADFLSSIEVCVLDSASLMLMQNIEHLRLVLQAINVKPKEAPNADFSRLREWNLSFLGAYFRQTIVFAHGVEPLLQNLVNKCCKNQTGVIKYVRNYDSNVGESLSSITRVVPQVKQIFQRIDIGVPRGLTPADEVELRFEYFQKHIFTPLLDNPRRHVLIFVPSYFDYVRIRNLFHETMNQKLIRAVQCCEYTTNKQVSRARTSFFHGRCHVMLFTERFHFYHQYQIRGIHQIIWYGMPQMGEFYPEMLNMLEDTGADGASDGVTLENKSSIALFTRLDLFRLQRVVGQKRAERMCQLGAKKSTFLFC